MTQSTSTLVNPSLRIDKLHLTNYRGFADLAISFDPSLTVLVASNGQGKTAVLDAIATALGPFVGAFDDGKDRAFDRDDIRLLRAGTGNRMELADGGLVLEAAGIVDYKDVSWKRQLAGPKSRTTRKDAQGLIEFGKRLQREVRQEAEVQRQYGEAVTIGACLPLVAYYPTDRLWNIRRLPYKKLPRTSRMVGYTHCLESGSDFHLMADWFRYWSINSLNQRLKAQQLGEKIIPSDFDHALEAVRNAINLCLKPSGWGNMDFSLEREEVVARHPEHGELPVGMLSDGIRSMLTLVADIAFRMVKLNPNLGPFAATETDGIVLIDEVDMHLHPAWQQTVLASLREAFPRIQFIVSTHSPQVLSSIHSRGVRLLGRDAESNAVASRPLARTYGEPSGDVLESVMQVDPQPPVPEKADLHRLTELVDQGMYDTDEAIQLWSALNLALDEQHPQLQRLQRSVQRQRALKA
ncbi:TPA: AAA family ATPase [Stenotrophomonas maltophilia]|nr:AAA family ATPase [Stenotrophomonas maltophilia]